jgi:two-component system, OmpR family, copper resistance phosphate regulon response regulator CusR
MNDFAGANSMRVLVVEDFQLLRESICQGLREAGYAVDAAADGPTGLWQAQSGEYDVIVLDLMLPGLDGLSVLRRLREAGCASHVLILTAKDTTSDRVGGLDAGADDYLVKPFELAELLARVRALVRRQYKSKDPILKVMDMEINTATRTVRRAGVCIALTPREYAMLEYMALRRGRIVTRAEIWKHVYDFNDEAASNVVDVYVVHLRRKIEMPGQPRILHTRRGHGYVLGDSGTPE